MIIFHLFLTSYSNLWSSPDLHINIKHNEHLYIQYSRVVRHGKRMGKGWEKDGKRMGKGWEKGKKKMEKITK